ncbi:metal-binding protein [Rhizobium sp. Root149]|uniref:DUF411 domain-containing protein n=1 Tax=Rhizobium sp. Root149 TaxID=1736473 RepID=UPI000713647B|nr:DUF411 domain-containing protein [Rhizobium sp. Root149]KQZ59730.1 metal-binding protein [Rhizobium sp. Root149]
MKRREFMLIAATAILSSRSASASQAKLTVHKDPYCGCCAAWASAFEDAGFLVELRDENDMAALKAKLKVPSELLGCHTATVGGYYLEGHVPLGAALRLLRERPPIAGLAVAGMPKGSLGMGTDPAASYDVMAVPRTQAAPSLYEAVRPR